MKIAELHIEGFRSLKDVTWRPGDLNVIIGPNGSGKSNLLRALELISATAENRLEKIVQKSGGFGQIAWDNDVSFIKWSLTTRPISISPSFHTYRLELIRDGLPNEYRLLDEELLRFEPEREDLPDHTPLVQFKRHGRQLFVSDLQGKQHQTKVEESDKSSGLVIGNSPFINNVHIQFFQSGLSRWAIYQGIRTDDEARLRLPAITSQDRLVNPDASNLVNVLHTLYTGDRQFEQALNEAMMAAFGSEFEKLIFTPDIGDQHIQMKVRWRGNRRDTSTMDLSDGTLRFLFLLTVLANPNPPPLIAIDEPETGLHPSMLPIIAECAVDAAERTQVIFTTHSDQFLDAFRVTDTVPTTTVAKWENGETTLTTLAGDQLEYWLKNYTLGSLYRSGELEGMAA